MTFAVALGACSNTSFSAASPDASTGAGGTAGSTGSGPALLASPPVSAGQASNGFLALDANTVYFTYQGSVAGGVAKTPKEGGGVSCLACDVGGPRGITAGPAFVYWTDSALGQLRREPVGGGPVQTLSTGTMGTPVVLGPNTVYWFDAGAGQVMRADLNGGNAMALAAAQSNVGSMAADTGVLFWTTDTAVVALDLATAGAPTLLAPGRSGPKSVAVDATHVYWVEGQWDQPDNSVQRVARTGGNPEAITPPGAASGFGIALDATHVYVADNYGGTIWRVLKSGGAPEVLASNQPNPFDIAVDSVAVYWTSETSAEVFSLAK